MEPDPRLEIRWLTRQALKASLTRLVPIPFLDDWSTDLVRQATVAELLKKRGIAPVQTLVRRLALGPEADSHSCLASCLTKAIIWPLRFAFRLVFKKLMRTLFAFLAVKDCVTAFTNFFHEAYLIRKSLDLSALPEDDSARFQRVAELRDAIERTLLQGGKTPHFAIFTQIFRRSFNALVTSALSLARRLRADQNADAYGKITEATSPFELLVDELADEITREGAFLRKLESLLEENLRTPLSVDDLKA
jgi:hypothetical protein